MEKYSLYSEFDIDLHAKYQINYLEVIIDSEGVVHYAIPSHQMFMENLLKERVGEEQFREMLKTPEADDYLNFLCTNTNCLSVWNEFYYGKPNKKQMETLKKLREKTYDKMKKLPLYQGKLVNSTKLSRNELDFFKLQIFNLLCNHSAWPNAYSYLPLSSRLITGKLRLSLYYFRKLIKELKEEGFVERLVINYYDTFSEEYSIVNGYYITSKAKETTVYKNIEKEVYDYFNKKEN